MAYREFFSVRVECEVATMCNPIDKQEFDEWCKQRVIKEREALGFGDHYEMRTELLRRDPEGPGTMMQPVLLRYGFDFPELTPL